MYATLPSTAALPFVIKKILWQTTICKMFPKSICAKFASNFRPIGTLRLLCKIFAYLMDNLGRISTRRATRLSRTKQNWRTCWLQVCVGTIHWRQTSRCGSLAPEEFLVQTLAVFNVILESGRILGTWKLTTFRMLHTKLRAIQTPDVRPIASSWFFYGIWVHDPWPCGGNLEAKQPEEQHGFRPAEDWKNICWQRTFYWIKLPQLESQCAF